MAEQKYTLILLLVGCFVASATACNQTQVDTCLAGNDLEGYEYPVLLDVRPTERTALCANIQNFTTCIDEFPREDCLFAQTKAYEPYESMAEFICADVTTYANHYVVISNDAYRFAWDDCLDDFRSLNEDSAEGCGVLNELVQCYVDEISGESPETQAYIESFVTDAYEYYFTHYLCPSGSSTVGITSSLMLMSLLAYLWSTFH